MCRQTPSGPTSTQTPFEVALGAGRGAAEAGAAAGVVAAGAPPRARARLGEVGSEEPGPEPGWVSCLLWPGPPRPAARPRDVPEMGIGPTEATGEVPAADDRGVVRGVGRTRMETVENSRNAIAPPESTMIGTVLPAGCRRKTAPARPTPVLIRSASSARAS